MTFVGRREALAAIRGVLAAGAGCVLVEGPAGIGKSRLLAEAAGLARAHGLVVAAGRATELDRVAPLSTLRSALAGVVPLEGARTENPAAARSRTEGRAATLPRTADPVATGRERGPMRKPVTAGPADDAGSTRRTDHAATAGRADDTAATGRGEHDTGAGRTKHAATAGRADDTVAAGLNDSAGRGVGEGSSAAGLGEGFGGVEAIGDALERFPEPLLVVLDDVQWADELSLLALRRLVPGGASVVWLLARRPLPRQEALDRLEAVRVPLPPLSAEEAAELTGHLLGAPPSPPVLEVVRASGGNPFLLEEALSAVREDGRIGMDGGFPEAVERRLLPLTEATRRLLAVAAVLRRPFSVHEAAGVLGGPVADVVARVEEAVQAGVLVDEGGRLAFRHDLIREAVYGGLPEAVRSAWHREAAAVLRAEGRPAAELAEHLRHGARRGDAAAVTDLRAAAADLTATAPSAAADLMTRALDLSDTWDPALVADAVRLLASAGRLTDARTLADHRPTRPSARSEAARARTSAHPRTGTPQAPADGAGPSPGPPAGAPDTTGCSAGDTAGTANAAEPSTTDAAQATGMTGYSAEYATGAAELSAGDAAAICLGLAEALKHAGDDAGVVERTGRVLAAGGVPVGTRARLLAVRAHALMMTGRVGEADAAAARAVAIGEPFGQVVALQARSTVALFRGEPRVALEHADRAVRVADAAGGEVAHRHPRLWLGAALTVLDRFGEAEAVYATVAREAAETGTAWSLPLLHRFRSELLLAWGRVDDAEAEAEAGLRMAAELSAAALTPALLGMLGHLAALRGDRESARRSFRRAAELAGGPGLVRDELRFRTALFEGTPSRRGGLGWEGGALTYLLLQEPWAAARLRREPGVIETIRILAERHPEVVSLRAAAAHAQGRPAEAVELYSAGPRPLGLAVALEEVGRREEALGVYAACGIRRGVGGPQVVGWGALTRSEVRVARLVARGLTNREVAAELFVSPHTVDSHLRHAFAKLGVRSRVELTRQVLAHDEEP